MKILLNKHARKLFWVYIVLTLIKLFTANIYSVREEDPTIYFKFYPSIENKFIAYVESGQMQDYYYNKYQWYKNNQYWEILHSPGGMQDVVESLYGTVISLWWISSAGLIIFALYKLFVLNSKKSQWDKRDKTG